MAVERVGERTSDMIVPLVVMTRITNLVNNTNFRTTILTKRSQGG